MPDIATPNLPSRNFEETATFFGKLGFNETWRDANWMILKHGEITLEFFPYPDLDPASSSFSCCFRLDDVSAFYTAILAAGVSEKRSGWPRAHKPKPEPWGGVVGALIDPDGTLIRLVQVPD
ncbi:bleomycin resistance protein [Sphingomonas sp. Leaf33]|uniref:bleomycin resistance protein n=1 Tax=Sphingomonas sp. Leaf33 TaxID=1736215 RepID=UPI0009E8A514|nr:bleomycin resistance protein [Sphingomonas sp. Leaf33]